MSNLIFGIFQTLGLGVFFYYLINGLKTKIRGLEQTINVQKQTLETMEKRIIETERIGDIYRNLLTNLPADIDNYRTILSKTRDETILELTNQNEITKKKLEDAEKQIQQSGIGKDTILVHLKVLTNMLSERKGRTRTRREYYLTRIAEFDRRTLENSVSLIIQSQTVEEFLEKSGFVIHVTEDRQLIKEIFDSQGQFEGKPIRDALATQALLNNAFHAAVNEHFYLN